MRLLLLGPLLAALLLAGCSGGAPPPIVSAAPEPPPPRAGAAWGIDLAHSTSPFLDQLRHGRIQFVARYYRAADSRLPALTAAEARRLSDLGLKIVAVWESHSANPVYFSYARGYWDAVTAAHEAAAVGQPAGSAIYFGVDFNAQGWQLAAVDQYFRGVDAGLAAAGGGWPRYEVGVYGSGAVCSIVKGSGLAHYAWLSNSTAWAGVRSYQGWNIRQGTRFATLSFDHDADEAWGDFGGFQVDGSPVLAKPAVAVADIAAPPAAAPPRQQEWVIAALGRWLSP
ncbi:MAG TPA: glycoside hydrolase domain-containing protein [Stellaceae bacterium]|nr:glycoside hydrolase domain-containing protein [Stellaceae bacterium]